ncbi:DUF547 domain-containing protein [Zeaxanthinibacter enoshimensis]|uniref:Uncharacterized protein DUF547 n=1 Tax=Zeaxanthinibacter enoshimensis TaxID=392009 RepID=A0A4R6TTP6_9FLAO|nr:DUF547 domain-containing protein [Zeaxanthinibacter enoshimensis]TDQ33299.1 uncharacterized protein DUF547 [Zeaxanthinibacter enoshimensis]
MNYLTPIFLLLSLGTALLTGHYAGSAPVKIEQKDDLHMSWQYLLNNYVSREGNVNYSGMKKEVSVLDTYLDVLAGNVPATESSREEKMAYYINLYNAATVRLVLEHYPVKSIKDLEDPWDTEWIRLGDQKVSLGYIENQVLRKMDDPRIHFAINCASYSCPALSADAYRADTLEEQLRDATLTFIRDPRKNTIEADQLYISAIFDWYREDFTGTGTLIDYLNRYARVPVSKNATVKFKSYDWKLNDSN